MMAFISSSNSVDSNRWFAASYCGVLTHASRRFKTMQHCCRCIKLAIVHDVAEGRLKSHQGSSLYKSWLTLPDSTLECSYCG